MLLLELQLSLSVLHIEPLARCLDPYCNGRLLLQRVAERPDDEVGVLLCSFSYELSSSFGAGTARAWLGSSEPTTTGVRVDLLVKFESALPSTLPFFGTQVEFTSFTQTDTRIG
jgi:hypothetical protein